QLEGDLADDRLAGEEFRMLERRAWLGWTYLYRDNPGGALAAARALANSDLLPHYIFAWRAAGRLSAVLSDEFTFGAAVEGLRKIAGRYPSTYISASIAGVQADWAIQTGDLASAEKFVIQAVGLFRDPQTLLTAAHFFRAKGDSQAELFYLKQLETAQGRILKHEWPGWIPVLRFEMARCLIGLNR